MNPPFIAYGCPMPFDPFPQPSPWPYPWPAPPPPSIDVSPTIIINNNEERTDAEHDLDELMGAVTALPIPMTEAGMRLAATVAKLRERQRQRLGLPEAAK